MKKKYKSIRDFEIQAKVNGSSQGSYGVVVNAIRVVDRKEFAMKFFGYTKNKPDVSWILREIDNLRALEGINGVAQIEATFTDSAEGYISHMIQKKFKRRYPVIVMEKLSGGDLFDRIAAKKFSERDASIVFSTFMKALTEIHDERHMINIDLKTENLVFSGKEDEAVVKIIDFGMAVSLWDRNEYFEDRLVGTSAFLAPETIVHYERYGQAVYSRASDIWQAGCILYMILAAQYPFGSEATHTGAQLLGNIKARRLQLTGLNLSSDALDLLSKIFVLDPNDRLAGQEILAHPWIVHHSKLPETDFGDSYKSRLKNWSCRKRFRQLLDRNVLGSRARQHALHTVLSLAGHPNPPFLPHHGYMTRSDTSADYLTMDSVQSPQRDEVKPLKRAESLRLFSISSQDIKTLKSAFFDFVSIRIQSPLLDEKKSTIFGSPPPTPLSAPSLSSNNKRFSPSSSANGIQIARFGEDLSVQNTLHHAGIDFDSFTTVVNAAGFTALATREIFDIFDWHRTQSVDYLEFLFTLSSFRRDVDWNDAASVARLYYDIFDMTSVNAISVDMLALVLSKLLTVHDTDEEKNTISLSSLKLADPSFEQTSDSTENEPSVEKDIDSLLSAVPTDSEEDLSAGNIYDVVQSIDTDGDGLITFKDFEAFFHVILRLRSMSSR